MAKAATRPLEEDDPSEPAKKQVARKTLGQDTQTSPSAGRVGGAGARAERPSEGSNRKTAATPQVGRGAKAPSAEDGKRTSVAKSERETNEGTPDEDLPQAARDSTG